MSFRDTKKASRSFGYAPRRAPKRAILLKGEPARGAKPLSRIVIAQGGGPTAVINQSLVGAVLEAKKQGLKIIGAQNGIKGIREEKFVDLFSLDDAKLSRIADTIGSALGSTRDSPDEAYCQQILTVFKKQDIRGFFYIGGNDSSGTINTILQFAAHDGYEMKGFHIPKTVDNDLVENDHTPGFPSAARFVAKATLGIERDNASLPGIHLLIMMGRHAGFLTTAAALGGAHLIYPPEYPFDIDAVAGDIQAVLDQHGRAVLGISEGVAGSDGKPVITHFVKNEMDAHGNIQLSGLPLGNVLADFLKEKLKTSRVRQDTFGYPQRCYPDASPVDREEAREVGRLAIQYFVEDRRQSGSITINRAPGSKYRAVFGIIDLSAVAGKTRKLPKAYYDPATKTVTKAGLDYLRPLVGRLPEIEQL